MMSYYHKLVCAVIALLVLCKLARCQNECTHSLNLTTGQHYQITPNNYTPSSDCIWKVRSSQGHRVKLTCEPTYMPSPDSSCKDYLAVTTTDDLQDASTFCVPFTKSGPSLKIQLTSSRWSQGGNFSCDITTEEIPLPGPNQTENCDWPQTIRFYGGSHNEFPSMVRVISFLNETYYKLCGGTIIARRVVLTAAQCLDPEPTYIGLIVGEHEIIKSDDTNYEKHLKVSRVIIHPNASESEGLHDIALLVTATDIEYSARAAPACLPFNIKKEDLIGNYVTATGWGRLQENGLSASRLQKVNLHVVPDSKCAPFYKKNEFTPQYHLCIYEKKKDTCNGDSGGPLYHYKHQKNCHIAVGIVSHGIGCGRDIPSVNVDLHYHLPWILDQLPDFKFCKK